jgi:endoglucanase
MYALVDWHQLSPGDPNFNLARAKTFFTAIANTHKNKNNIIYDVCNEPNSGATWAKIKTYADQIIPVIRAIDNDAVVLVGTHGWSTMGLSGDGSLQDILNNRLQFSNIMYTFHFYAKDHRTQYLNQLDQASNSLPVFVTEFGTQEASGDGPNDFPMAQQFIDLMQRKKISWTNWNYSDDFRSGAVWTTGTCSNGPWTTARLKPAGLWIRERMLTPADDFPGGTPVCVPVSASANDGNVPANVQDNDLNTRWSAEGDGQWIQFCLSSTTQVSGADIAFYNGTARRTIFDIQTSIDGLSFSNAATGLQSSGTSTALETFTFTSRSAKYVRILGHGNTLNAWNSLTEVKIRTASTSQQSATAFKESITTEKTSLTSFPNPFGDNSTVSFYLEKRANVLLALYDISGKQVAVLKRGPLDAGRHNTSFTGNTLPKGVYTLKLIYGENVITKKVLKQ